MAAMTVAVAPSASISGLTSAGDGGGVGLSRRRTGALGGGGVAAAWGRAFRPFLSGVQRHGAVSVVCEYDSGYSNTTLGGAAPVGQWVHMVGTYDGAMVRFYVNGVQPFSTAHTGTLPATRPAGDRRRVNDAAHTPTRGSTGRRRGAGVCHRAQRHGRAGTVFRLFRLIPREGPHRMQLGEGLICEVFGIH